MAEGLALADGMDARQEAADPFQHVEVVQFRAPAAAARAHRKRKPVMVVQGPAIDDQRRDHRHLVGLQLGGEGVLFQDLGL